MKLVIEKGDCKRYGCSRKTLKYAIRMASENIYTIISEIIEEEQEGVQK